MISKRKFSKLDITITVSMIIIYIPLGIWMGLDKTSGKLFDYLVFLMPLGGLAFIIFESIRISSPLLGAILGALVPLLVFVPYELSYSSGKYFDIDNALLGSLLGCLFGFFCSTICWAVKRSKSIFIKKTIIYLTIIVVLLLCISIIVENVEPKNAESIKLLYQLGRRDFKGINLANANLNEVNLKGVDISRL